ncbi:MAG: SPOR domain-containing protein [Roseobacter sp.]
MADVEFSHGMGAYGRGEGEVAPTEAPDHYLIKMTNVAGAVLSVALIAGVGIWGYKLMVRDVTGIPVVRAAEGEMRIRPVEPGGQLARHQGLAVNAIAAQGVAAGPVDRVILAPNALPLSEEDQPVQQAAAPIAQPTQLPDAAAPAALPADPEGPPNDLTNRLQQGAIDDVVAMLVSGNTPLEGTKTVEARPAVVAQSNDPVVIDAPGVRLSIRPKLRPDDISTLLKPATFTPPAATAEIEASAIPSGTRLAQLGAFDSADVARTEWARLQARFGDVLQGKSRVVQEAQSGGRTFYRLRAMGFVDLNDTRRFCSAFKAEGVDCIPVQVK